MNPSHWAGAFDDCGCVYDPSNLSDCQRQVVLSPLISRGATVIMSLGMMFPILQLNDYSPT